MKSGAIYIRVSTDKQEELSPDAQKRLLLEYAEKNDIMVTNEFTFIENGISGRKADKRPQFMKMISLAKSKEHPFDVILVWKFSRFARNQEESIVYKSLLKKNNVDVVSVSEPLVDGPFGSLIERIIEWMDEYYSIRLSGEVMRGMVENAMRGNYQAQPPIGYKKIGGKGSTMVIDEEKAEIVRKIYDLYVNNDMQAFAIARYLNEVGYTTKKGGKFERRGVEYIIKNPTYYGMNIWNQKSEKDTKQPINDKSEWIITKGSHEPIITEELYKKAMDKYNRVYTAKCAKPYEVKKHWLSGMVKCSSCGKTLVYSGNAKVPCFACYMYKKGKCNTSSYINAKKLESGVIKGLEKCLKDGNYEALNVITPKKNDNTLEKALEKLSQKESRIKKAYINGIDTIEEYKENKKYIENERNVILAKLSTLKSTPHNTSINAEKIKIELARTIEMLSSDVCSVEEKQKAINKVIEHITYDKANDNICFFFFPPG